MPGPTKYKAILLIDFQNFASVFFFWSAALLQDLLLRYGRDYSSVGFKITADLIRRGARPRACQRLVVRNGHLPERETTRDRCQYHNGAEENQRRRKDDWAQEIFKNKTRRRI